MYACTYVYTYTYVCVYRIVLQTGIAQLCHILFDNESMADVISVLHFQKVITVDDAEILQHFAMNKHFQKQFLIWCLQNLRLPVWLTICDALLKQESMEHTGNQLLNGDHT